MSQEQEIVQRLDRIEAHLKREDKPLNLEEAAEYLDISRSHLYKLTSKGEIPHYKPRGKRLYFTREDLNTWMRQGRVASGDEIEAQASTYAAVS